MVQEITSKLDKEFIPENFQKIKGGLYQFGSKKVTIQKLNEKEIGGLIFFKKL